MSDDMFYARVCAERDRLRAELAAARKMAEANWTECEKLRDSMWEYRADNARLRAALKALREEVSDGCAEDAPVEELKPGIDFEVVLEVDAVLATPAQSLAAHDAALLREVADREFNPEQSAEERWAHGVLHGNADRIEKEAQRDKA